MLCTSALGHPGSRGFMVKFYGQTFYLCTVETFMLIQLRYSTIAMRSQVGGLAVKYGLGTKGIIDKTFFGRESALTSPPF